MGRIIGVTKLLLTKGKLFVALEKFKCCNIALNSEYETVHWIASVGLLPQHHIMGMSYLPVCSPEVLLPPWGC